MKEGNGAWPNCIDKVRMKSTLCYSVAKYWPVATLWSRKREISTDVSLLKKYCGRPTRSQGETKFTLRCVPKKPGRCFHCCFITMVQQPPVGQGFLINEASRSHSLRHTTLCRNSQEKWSARRRDLFLTTHDSHKRQTSMSLAGLVPASERPQTTPARPLGSFFFSHRRVTKSENDVLRQILFVTCLKILFRPAYIYTAPSRGVPIIRGNCRSQPH